MRWLLLSAGVLCTALGAAGAFLPLLPTTPFLLLAAACFVRSSPALHRRLLANRIFGPYLAQWQRDRTVPRDAKRKAYGLVVLTFAVSIALTKVTWLRVTLAGLGLALIGFLAWLPTTPRGRGPEEGGPGEATGGERRAGGQGRGEPG
jgi:uncharacterized membrane protein YbaN (DUF454 family)